MQNTQNTQFKAGDKVKILNHCSNSLKHYLDVGSTAEVLLVESDRILILSGTESGEPLNQSVDVDSVELIEETQSCIPKVGDFVFLKDLNTFESKDCCLDTEIAYEVTSVNTDDGQFWIKNTNRDCYYQDVCLPLSRVERILDKSFASGGLFDNGIQGNGDTEFILPLKVNGFPDLQINNFPSTYLQAVDLSKVQITGQHKFYVDGKEVCPDNYDIVNKPKHYILDEAKGIEVRDVCAAVANRMQESGKYSGMFISDYVQALQYILRFDLKNGIQDLEKAGFYLNKMIEAGKGE